MRAEGGTSAKAHLLHMRKMQGHDPDDLLDHESLLPEELAFLWQWFMELHATRGLVVGVSGGVFLALSYTEVEAWARLRAIDLAPWHVGVLRHLDSMAVAVLNER